MSSRSIRIHVEAPAKPAWGSACNGCGVCCLAEPCPVGMVLSLRVRGACAALRWDDGLARYRCGLMTTPATLRSRLAARWIGAGRGCDSSAEIEGAG